MQVRVFQKVRNILGYSRAGVIASKFSEILVQKRSEMYNSRQREQDLWCKKNSSRRCPDSRDAFAGHGDESSG